MKLQAASRHEVIRIAKGCGICAVLELVGLFLLSILGIGHFSYRMVLGTLGGTFIAIINFTMMCLMVQNAAGIADQKLLKAKVQGSYNLRLLVQAAWVVFAFIAKSVNVLSAVIPLLFPTAIIYYLQMKGKLVEPSEVTSADSAESATDTEPEDNLNTFEV